MRLLRAGETCWRTTPGGRVKLLVDGQDYFEALLWALRAARSSIHILGWAFDPRTALRPGADEETRIGHLLVEAARRGVDARVLVWRSALPVSATQDFFPHRARGWFKGTPVRFELDDMTPLGACHHQKVVVVDDALAFVGSADLAPGRWDSPQHLDDDPRRGGPGAGPDPPPRHEVAAMVDGPIAVELGELFRARWRTGVGEEAPAAGTRAGLWPDGVAPDVGGAAHAVGRTFPAWRSQAPVREIADLTLEAIGAAKSLIYIENQYFTWPLAVEALAARLAEPDGPEIVLICPWRSPSYFDRITMDRARSNAIWRLKRSDVFERFHPLAPFAPGGRPVIDHAKLMVVDDRLARIGSANLNNRSQGFDTECELAIEADHAEGRAALDALVNRLAGHWVGATGDQVAELRRGAGSLSQAIWALDRGRRLRALGSRWLGPVGEFIADFHIGDPADTVDSWRPWLRRERLAAEARALRQDRRGSGRPPAAGGPRPSGSADRTAPAPPRR